MTKPYQYVRFSLWRDVDLDKISKELHPLFRVEKIPRSPDKEQIISSHKRREHVKITADTLMVRLSSTRAVLYQKEKAPFTEKDIKLRQKILQIYTHSQSSFFLWEVNPEPKFEVETEQ